MIPETGACLPSEPSHGYPLVLWTTRVPKAQSLLTIRREDGYVLPLLSISGQSKVDCDRRDNILGGRLIFPLPDGINGRFDQFFGPAQNLDIGNLAALLDR